MSLTAGEMGFLLPRPRLRPPESTLIIPLYVAFSLSVELGRWVILFARWLCGFVREWVNECRGAENNL